MDLVGWAAWAWIIGIPGVIVALLLLVRALRSTPGPATDAAARLHAVTAAFLRPAYLGMVAVVIPVAALVGLATSPLTAAAVLAGAVCAVIPGLLGAPAVRRTSAALAAGEGAGALPRAFGAGAVAGLALTSLVLLGLGAWYMALGAGAITDTDFQSFGRVIAGFALGAGLIALVARVGGGIYSGAARLGEAAAAGAHPDLGPEDARNPATPGARAAGIVGDVVGTATGLFESVAGGTVAAMVVGASAQIYATSRGAAVSLPLLTVLVDLVVTLLALALARALARQRLETALGNVSIVSTVLFLALEYGVVRALGFEIVDPTGARVFRPDAPFWAILAGTVAGLIMAGLAHGAPASKGRRRLAELGPAGAAGGLGAALEASAAPAFLVALAVWLSYYAAGIYGIGLAAIGMLGTAGLAAAIAGSGASVAGTAAVAGPDAGEPGEVRRQEMAAAGRHALAVGKGISAAGAALTALSLFIAYVSASGAEEAGLELLDSALLAGLLLGVLAIFLVAGLAVHGAASIGARVAEEAGRQLHENKGLLHGRGKVDTARLAAIASPAALRRTIAPGLILLLLPVVAGILDIELLSGLLVGATFAGLLLALFFGHTAAIALGTPPLGTGDIGSPPSAQLAGPWRTLAGPLADAAAPAIGTAMKLMAAVALVLAPWFARLHGASILQSSLRDGASQLLALLH